MDLTVISTYRCNSHCSTCDIWKHPTRPVDEISLDLLKKIPAGIDNLNISGGEPTLRADLAAMVDILHPKARKLEISSNGLFPERLEAIVSKYPDIKIRFSLEGTDEVNNTIRGEKNGFQAKVDGLRRLKELGGCDLGFAVTIHDDNVQYLDFLYCLTRELGVELATSALHNGFQFHKNDNFPYDRLRVAHGIEGLIAEMLKTNSVKNWFRAYLNLGLMEKILGNDRLIPCTAATDFFFVDPWSDVYACNVRNDLLLGNLKTQTWDEVDRGERAVQIRKMVAACKQNCWMVGSARTAMRNPVFTRLPKLKPLWWVLVNKARVTLGLPIPFERYVDFRQAAQYKPGAMRQPYSSETAVRRELHAEAGGHYDGLGQFFNQ
jgi:MoaA/NifB/PqqE/SkfB family radical SAM enzyme